MRCAPGAPRHLPNRTPRPLTQVRSRRGSYRCGRDRRGPPARPPPGPVRGPPVGRRFIGELSYGDSAFRDDPPGRLPLADFEEPLDDPWPADDFEVEWLAEPPPPRRAALAALLARSSAFFFRIFAMRSAIGTSNLCFGRAL